MGSEANTSHVRSGVGFRGKKHPSIGNQKNPQGQGAGRTETTICDIRQQSAVQCGVQDVVGMLGLDDDTSLELEDFLQVNIVPVRRVIKPRKPKNSLTVNATCSVPVILAVRMNKISFGLRTFSVQTLPVNP